MSGCLEKRDIPGVFRDNIKLFKKKYPKVIIAVNEPGKITVDDLQNHMVLQVDETTEFVQKFMDELQSPLFFNGMEIVSSVHLTCTLPRFTFLPTAAIIESGLLVTGPKSGDEVGNNPDNTKLEVLFHLAYATTFKGPATVPNNQITEADVHSIFMSRFFEYLSSIEELQVLDLSCSV